MKLITQFYITVIRVGYDYQEVAPEIAEKVLKSLQAFQEAVNASWKVEREAMLTLSKSQAERRTVCAAIRECAAADCGVTTRSGESAVPDEIWELTQ